MMQTSFTHQRSGFSGIAKGFALHRYLLQQRSNLPGLPFLIEPHSDHL